MTTKLDIISGVIPVAEGSPHCVAVVSFQNESTGEYRFELDEQNLDKLVQQLQRTLAQLSRRNSEIRKEETYK